MRFSRQIRFLAALLIAAMLGNNIAIAAKPVDPMAIKAKVQARGVGQGVRVTMADKTETKGVIVNIGDQAFTVKPKGGAQPQEIQYAQVSGVHKDKMGTGTKVLIMVVVAGAAIGIAAAVIDHDVNKSLSKITF